MSYTELKIITLDGNVRAVTQFSNSHGFVQAIWNPICERFLGDRYAWINWDPMRLLAYDKRVPQRWRAMLQLTFDRAIIEPDFYAQAAEDMRKFFAETHDPSTVNHLENIGNVIGQIAVEDKAERNTRGICFRCTSVASDLWRVQERPDGESERSYNLDRDSGHFSVYAQIYAEG